MDRLYAIFLFIESAELGAGVRKDVRALSKVEEEIVFVALAGVGRTFTLFSLI